MQSRIIGTSFDSQSPPHFIARMRILAIVCGGFLLGQVDAQYHDDSDHIVFPGAVGSRSRDRTLDNENPAGDSDDSDTVNWYRLTSSLN